MILLCIFVAIAGAFDYWQRRIPNLLLAVMAVAGFRQSIAVQGAEGCLGFVFRILCVTVSMYPLFKIGAMGAGDIKLYGVCAGYLPGDKVLFFLFFSLLIGAGFSLIKMITEQNAKERLQYLFAYIAEVIKTGSWGLYLANCRERRSCCICLAGPILGSVLMCAGGIY